MHHYHFLLFSILLTFALPSFAWLPLFNKSRWIKILENNEGSVELSLYTPDSKGERRSSIIPFNGLGIPTRDLVTSISVFRVFMPIKGTNEAGETIELTRWDILCQCFKDESGKEAIGEAFTVAPTNTKGTLIPEDGRIKTIYCSDWPGLVKYLEKVGIQPDHFLKNPSTVEGGKVTLSVKDSKSGKPYPLVIPFHSIYKPNEIHQASRIAVIGVKGVNSLNTVNDLVTLEAKDILCQCFRDKDGTYPLGIPFSVAPEKGGPRYFIPNVEQTMSIICSDAQWLHGYLRTLFKVPAIPRRSILS
ncbi:MAG: hypothetical protein Q9177_002900 [Variospora cf. flavescens]